jgi:hypothetical protein
VFFSILNLMETLQLVQNLKSRWYLVGLLMHG